MTRYRGFSLHKFMVLTIISIIMAATVLAPVDALAEKYPENVKGKALYIGALFDLSGGSRASIEALCGAKAAVDWINSRGGVFVKGVRYYVQLVYYDITYSYGGTPRTLDYFATKLIDEGASVILAPPESDSSIELLELFSPKGRLGEYSDKVLLMVYSYINSSTIRRYVEDGVNVMMPVTPNEALVTEAFRVAEVLQSGAKVYVVVSSSSVWNASAPPSLLERAAKASGVDLTGSFRVAPENVKSYITSLISDIKEREPDILIVVGERSFIVNLLKSIYGSISVKAVIVVSEGYDPSLYGELTPIVAEGIIIVSDWLPLPVYTPERASALKKEWWGPTLEVFQRYMEENCPALEPTSMAARAAASILHIVKATIDSGSIEPQEIAENIVKHSHLTFYGPVNIERAVHTGGSPTYAQIREGKLETGNIQYPAPNWYGEEEEQAGTPAAVIEGAEEEGGVPSILAVAAAIIVVAVVLGAAAFALRKRG
ncbi:MAG: ABC transporter substrate-binding protein [Desulfurococcales archaeon]|nr:ABC transporter substrate-binding protein [Desulfurococcales archaeon]